MLLFLGEKAWIARMKVYPYALSATQPTQKRYVVCKWSYLSLIIGPRTCQYHCPIVRRLTLPPIRKEKKSAKMPRYIPSLVEMGCLKAIRRKTITATVLYLQKEQMCSPKTTQNPTMVFVRIVYSWTVFYKVLCTKYLYVVRKYFLNVYVHWIKHLLTYLLKAQFSVTIFSFFMCPLFSNVLLCCNVFCVYTVQYTPQYCITFLWCCSVGEAADYSSWCSLLAQNNSLQIFHTRSKEINECWK